MFDREQSCFVQRLSRNDLKLPRSERGDLLKENLGQLEVYEHRKRMSDVRLSKDNCKLSCQKWLFSYCYSFFRQI